MKITVKLFATLGELLPEDAIENAKRLWNIRAVLVQDLML